MDVKTNLPMGDDAKLELERVFKVKFELVDEPDEPLYIARKNAIRWLSVERDELPDDSKGYRKLLRDHIEVLRDMLVDGEF